MEYMELRSMLIKSSATSQCGELPLGGSFHMKGYWIIFGGEVIDQKAKKQYGTLPAPLAEKYQAETRVLDSGDTLRESLNSRRVVIVKFPSLEAAKSCYDDSEYRKAKEFAVKA
jgi:uncharacterized protein (DUF1330 family)